MRTIPGFTQRTAAAAAVLLVAGCAVTRGASPAAPSAPVGVRLMHHERAVPHARVSAVRDPGVAFREERIQALAGADGRAFLALPAGVWYLRAEADDPPLFGWYGSNPVTVRPGEPLDVVLPAVARPPTATVSKVAPGEEAVAGEVVGEEGPAFSGVAFYLDLSTQLRGPGYIETQAGPDGRFEVQLSPGRYWVVARRRHGPGIFGPLDVGDLFGFYPGNPLEVRRGQRVEIRVPAVRVLKKSGWSGPSTLRTRIVGTIRDGAGTPLAGYRAFLHAKPTLLGKPEFVSEPSGPDGAYLIWADREGVYYLGARAEIGRAREERERIGLRAGSPDHAVTVRLGASEAESCDIVVEGEGTP